MNDHLTIYISIGSKSRYFKIGFALFSIGEIHANDFKDKSL